MDLATISQELNKRFLAPLPEFYKRRIIVWYDEEKEFEDQIGELELQDHSCGRSEFCGNTHGIQGTV